MRVRKKPDLRLNIPSYPHDYVEIPPETRRALSAVVTTDRPSYIPYIDDDDDDNGSQPNIHFNPQSPRNEFRSETPEIKITEMKSSRDKEISVSPLVSGSSSYNRDFKGASCSVPDQLNNYNGDQSNNVSLSNVVFSPF